VFLSSINFFQNKDNYKSSQKRPEMDSGIRNGILVLAIHVLVTFRMQKAWKKSGGSNK
jgi:hypothetical protein